MANAWPSKNGETRDVIRLMHSAAKLTLCIGIAIVITTSALLAANSSTAATPPSTTTQTFTSGPAQVSLVELYTSEGCSSCPPADAWLGNLTRHPDLWERFVPVAFHVDYWNYLGWKDRWSKPHHSKRQRQYQREGGVKSVYTPGFVVNGQEWRGWFSRKRLPDGSNPAAGVLSVAIGNDALTASYTEPAVIRNNFDLHVALLGFDLQSNVRSGENRGKRLEHQFVVVEHVKYRSDSPHWSVPVPSASEETERYGLAVWVTEPGKQQPLQATGGWLY